MSGENWNLEFQITV